MVIRDIENYVVNEDMTLYAVAVPATEAYRIALHGNGVNFVRAGETYPIQYTAVYPGKRMIADIRFEKHEGKKLVVYNSSHFL